MTEFDKKIAEQITVIESAKSKIPKISIGEFSPEALELRAAFDSAKSYLTGRMDAFDTALNILRDPSAGANKIAIIKMHLEPAVVGSHESASRTAGQKSAVKQVLAMFEDE